VPENGGSAPARARSFWSGTITFGLVSVPVNLLPAYRSDRISLRMVSPEGHPLTRRYVTPRDGRPLDWEQIVRGYEVEKDRYVVLDDDELERLAPERTRDIDLRRFVKMDQIDPMHFERAYYLTPDGSSTKAYRLLARVMEETGRAGIATFVMRAKEYLVAIVAENGILRAETLRFADEVRTPESIGLPDPAPADAGEVKEIRKEIGALSEDELDPDVLEDPTTERLRKLVRDKSLKKKDVVRAPDAGDGDAAPSGGAVPDLMEMLQRSLRSSGQAEAADAGAGPEGDAEGAADDRLEDRSKGDLYEQAKALDIPGRSGMTKDELVEAIRRTG
jgi:DNA end-binding protein Ku